MKALLRSNGEAPHGRDAAIRSCLRFTAIAAGVAMLIIAIGKASRTDGASRDLAPPTPTNDPLATGLARCRDVTADQMASDDSCRRVWAEHRRRFFAPSSKPAEAR